MKRILITGGAGFIGSNLTIKLLSQGTTHVTCIDNFDLFYPRTQKEQNILPFLSNKDYCFIEGDIRNIANIEMESGFDVIVHLAAKAGVRQSIENPFLYQDVNVAGTQNLLEYAKDNNVKQFIFASSSSVYGVNANVPWNEDERLLPISPYASSKLADEMLGHVYSHLHGIRFISLRLFTVYGPGQRPDLAIHRFFDSILKDLPISMFGNGNTSRDYTYVGDVIEGIIAALNYSDSLFEIINLGNYKTVTLKKLVRAIESTCGKKAVIEYCAEQPGDVPHTYADIGKAQRLLGYQPKTNLKNGLNAFYCWYQNSNSPDSLSNNAF